jgi:hypothetical protein
VLAVFGANVAGKPEHHMGLPAFTDLSPNILDNAQTDDTSQVHPLLSDYDMYASTPYMLPPCDMRVADHVVLPDSRHPLVLIPGHCEVPVNSGITAWPFGVNTLCELHRATISWPDTTGRL